MLKNIKRSSKNWKLEEITTEEFEDWKPKKVLTKRKHRSILSPINKRKQKEVMSKVKEQSKKQGKNLVHEAKLVVVGISNLAFVVAESIAAYVLAFSGQTTSLRVVAGVLVADASIRAVKQFIAK